MNRKDKEPLPRAGVSVGAAGPVSFEVIVNKSSAMRAVLQKARYACRNGSKLILTGPTGGGKDLLARAIVANGPRSGGPFIAINCAAIPSTLAESEILGHEEDAFSGSKSIQQGLFELAHGGTLFLDEVTSLSPEIQAKLLRVLQDGLVKRVGGNDFFKFDVRIISATNRDIEAEVQAKRFRDDLYYRLKCIHIHVPGLCERPEDVPWLLDHFLKGWCGYFGKKIEGFTPEAWRLLCEYPWPGNVRELENAVECLVGTVEDGMIGVEHLNREVVEFGRDSVHPSGTRRRSLKDIILDAERRHILGVLEETKGNRTEAARILGIGRGTLRAKLAQYGILSDLERALDI